MGESCTNKKPLDINVNDLEVMCNYRRLKYIRRFNNLPTVQTEDVAQHSFFTTILAMTLAEEYNLAVEKHNLEVHPYDVDNIWEKVDVNKVMKAALFHDIEEAFTSDIPWNVKHHSQAVHTIIAEATKDKLGSIYKNCSKVFKDHLVSNVTAKSGAEGQFVNIADMMECAWNCIHECQLGNVYLEGMLKKAVHCVLAVPLSAILVDTSPTFVAMMNLFEGGREALDHDVMNLE